MRGQKEGNALNNIKKFLFCDKLQKPLIWQDKTVYDFDDNEYRENINCCTNFVKGTIYGLSDNDRFEVFNAIRKAKENLELSKFPDFLFKNGVIEHFQITATKESKRKGSAEMADREKFNKELKQGIKQFYQYCNDNPCFGRIRSKEWIRQNIPESSYENLEKSFKFNLDKHLQSLEKYNGCKDVVVFLIENPELNIEMRENTFAEIKEGIRCDYPVRQEHFIRYMLSRDKNLLNYIYKYKDKIDYIIYYYHEGFEIIKVENIPELLKFLPHEYIMVSNQINFVHKVFNTSVKKEIKEENE